MVMATWCVDKHFVRPTQGEKKFFLRIKKSDEPEGAEVKVSRVRIY